MRKKNKASNFTDERRRFDRCGGYDATKGERAAHAATARATITHALIAAMLLLLPLIWATRSAAQEQDDPPGRVARVGYLTGSVSFQPGGEGDWVDAVENRPMTIGDKLWADRDSRAELQLGKAAIRLSENTGISFLNLDDRTVQVELSSGDINLRVRGMDRDDIFEVDTPNLAFTVDRPGSYRIFASEDGGTTVISLRNGEGEATGNGQTYTLHEGQRATFGGSDSLNADVEQIGGDDQFDSWVQGRDRRWDDSRSAQYCSRDLVGYDDLDEHGEWADDPGYGHVWYPTGVEAGWAPYRAGHWVWIDPWGYTWVDDEPWGYAPFHYGRWAVVRGRWGWIPGPVAVEPVYAPALVVFVGGAGGFGGNIAWFPLGPREVYVPSYRVSREYTERVNVSNTTVNTTVVTNVYNTTIVNNRTGNITNVNYVNRNAPNAVTAVPQRAFASAQPVARNVVAVNQREIASAPVTARVAVNPTREAVLGEKAGTASHAAAPPAAVINRAVVAKATPPPPPAPFAARQQAMASHPGQPLARSEMASMRQPTAAAAPQPAVRMAPPGKPATPTVGQPNSVRGMNRPGQPSQPGMTNRPGQPNQPQPNQPAAAPPNRPEPNRPPQPNNRPEPNQPPQPQPNNRPSQIPPATNRPESQLAQPNNRPPQPENRPPEAQPNRPERPPSAQPNNRPPEGQPPNRPQPENRPPESQPNNRPPENRPPQPGNRPPESQPNNRPERPPSAQPNNRAPEAQPPSRPPENRPPENRPPQPESRPQPNRPQTPPQGEQRPPERTPPPNARQQEPPQRKQEQKQTPEEKKRQQQDQEQK